jgi:hypothetical protein
MGRLAKVGHAKPLKTEKESDAAPGHQHKNSALIPFRFFLKKSHPKKTESNPAHFRRRADLVTAPFMSACGKRGHGEFKPPRLLVT